jgi:hypothetical protein
MVVDTPVKMFNLLFDAGQNLLVLAMLFRVTPVKPGEEPHDRPADQRDKDRHPHGLHGTSVPERFVSFSVSQHTIIHVPDSQLLHDRQHRRNTRKNGSFPDGDTTKQAGPTNHHQNIVAERSNETSHDLLHNSLLY